MNYDEILKCYEGETELHANTSFEFGLMNETYWCLFRDHDMLEYVSKLFYYVGEEDDQIPFSSLRKFEKYCIRFINSIEVEEDD